MAFLFASTWRMSVVTAKNNILRKSILKSVSVDIPKGINNMVLLVESDRSYYGLPGETKIVPFEASPAIVFGAYLYDKTYLPKVLSEYETFQKIDSQGYLHDSGGSYGYYWNYIELKMMF